MLNIVSEAVEDFFERIRYTFYSEKEKIYRVYCMRIVNTRATLIVTKQLNKKTREPVFKKQ